MVAKSPEQQARSSLAASLFLFFALAFALMWILFFTVAFVRIPARSPLRGGLILLGAFAPALAAVAVTFRTEGRSSVIALLRRITEWRVAARYYVFALGFMVAIKLTAALIYRAWTSSWPRFDTSQWYLIPVAIAFSTPFQAGEEIGWRGYALPRLAERFGLASASVLLGFIWAVWHLPQFFIRGGDSYQQSFPVFVLQVTAMSVAVAWLYMRTNGSLLLTMLLHAAINNSKDIVPSGVPGGTATFGFGASRISWIALVLLWGCAAYFLLHMRIKRWGNSTMQIRITLFLLIGSGTALSQFPPFQFLQKPGPNPVGLKVVNQYDPSRKFPATPDRPEAPAGQGSRPLQTLIWYPARQSRSKPMTVGDIRPSWPVLE